METFVLLRFKLVLNYLSPHGTCVAAFTSLIQPCAHTPVAVCRQLLFCASSPLTFAMAAEYGHLLGKKVLYNTPNSSEALGCC
jgi:hypothetical protein